MAKITPWTKIKAEYLQGATPKELALKYKTKAKTITEKASKEGWVVEKTIICNNLQEIIQDKIKDLSNNALEVLNEVMNSPEAKDADKISAAKAILDVSGLKTQKQEITGDIKTTNPVINILPVKAND